MRGTINPVHTFTYCSTTQRLLHSKWHLILLEFWNRTWEVENNNHFIVLISISSLSSFLMPSFASFYRHKTMCCTYVFLPRTERGKMLKFWWFLTSANGSRQNSSSVRTHCLFTEQRCQATAQHQAELYLFSIIQAMMPSLITQV